MKNILFLAFTLAAFILILGACRQNKQPDKEAAVGPVYPTTGSIERLNPALDQVIPPDAKQEVLAAGFEWSEGPLWLPAEQMLLFSDVPRNRIYRWQEGDTIATPYLEPSGYTGDVPRGGEPGSNGLTLDLQGRLVLCQHGDRRVARMEAPLGAPAPVFTTLADSYEGLRFNSPNDACFDSKGNLYFTDPPYGLVGNVDDPAKELPYQGVFRISPDGDVTLIDTLSRPNGIALAPDETKLYVAISDPEKALWMVYDILAEGGAGNGRVFHDATPRIGQGKGVPDGMKVDKRGNVFATGPGGVWVISPAGELLGIVRTGQATANCAFDTEERTLFITADSLLLRLPLAR